MGSVPYGVNAVMFAALFGRRVLAVIVTELALGRDSSPPVLHGSKLAHCKSLSNARLPPGSFLPTQLVPNTFSRSPAVKRGPVAWQHAAAGLAAGAVFVIMTGGTRAWFRREPDCCSGGVPGAA
jgi:hypothetical protein